MKIVDIVSGLCYSLKMKIQTAIGQHVRLVNNTDAQMDSGKVRIHCHGKLEFDEEDKEFYVRIGEDANGHGCNGVGFVESNVLETYRQPSGIIEITLKG